MKTSEQHNTFSIDELVSNYSDELYSWAYHKTKQKEAAQDLVQETFIVAYEKLDQFKNKSSIKTWLFGILKNKIADYFRTLVKQNITRISEDNYSYFFDSGGKWKTNQQPQNWEEESHLLDNPEFITILEFCKEKLPALWFSIIELKYITQKKGKEICQELSISETNYWQIMHRAKLSLRSCIDDNWFKSSQRQ